MCVYRLYIIEFMGCFKFQLKLLFFCCVYLFPLSFSLSLSIYIYIYSLGLIVLACVGIVWACVFFLLK